MEIPCKWKPIDEFTPKNEEKRAGRYHGSMFWNIKGFGSKRWVVGGYLEVDYQDLQSQGLSEKEIVEGCLAFLNRPPLRKKFQRKEGNPLYGCLEYYKHKCVPGAIEILATTNQRKNRHFWSEGPLL